MIKKTDLKFEVETFASPNLHALYFFITSSCNLDCKYCYVPHEIKDEQSQMSFHLAKEALDEFFDHLKKNNRKAAQIRFLGGEPLLGLNVIKDIYNYSEKVKNKNGVSVCYGMNTNATLIDAETAKWLSSAKNFNVIVSLDGLEYITKDIRVHKNRSINSFELISKGINYLKEHNKTVNINCVIASHNRNYLDKFFEHLNSLKVGNVVFEFASIPEDHANNIKIFPIPDDDKVNVIKEAQILATKYNINISGEWKFAVSNYFNKQESPYFCNAGIRALVISPDGDVYACQRFVGRKNHRLTKVKTGFIDEINIKSNDVYKGIVMRSPFVNIKSLNSKLDSGGCVKGESSGKSSEKFYQQLFNYYESLPPDKSVFNALDKKVHGMYFNPNIG